MSKQLAIVYCGDHDGHAGYFMMDKSDFRYDSKGPTGYQHVGNVTRRRGRVVGANGFRGELVETDHQGLTYIVYSDWSATQR